MNKSARLESLLPGGRGVWIPIDHGASDYPNEGLQDLENTIASLIRAGVNAIVAQKGVVSKYAHLCEGTTTSMVVHYSVSTRHGGPNSDNKVLVGNADETLSRGGIGVSCQVNMGSEHEAAMIERMGELNRQAHHGQLPSFGMIYARGKHLNVMKSDPTGGQAHAVRLAFELGCDAAKSVWTGDKDSFSMVSSAAPIPVLVAGGPATGDSLAILTMVKDAMIAGASGVCMGRQVFAHPQRESLARAIMMIVHENADVDDALKANEL
ncbi:MAG TPA: hypothetical protein QGI72_03235 [Poseidonia sp.]|nr:hypothetical protein [Poseidonia sp.]